MDEVMVPTAPGELIDKLTILRIKSERIVDREKLANVWHEKARLEAIADAKIPSSPDLRALWEELYQINAGLWVIEDDIRDHEAKGDFGPAFVQLARSVYFTNDRRAKVKKAINLLLGSRIIEEKSYSDHGGPA